MRVTVAVLTYNEQENMPDILGSLEKQTYPRENFEILIVDNGSADGTIQAIAPFQERMGNIRVVVNDVKGIAPSRNVALNEADGDLVAFTDADVIVPESWLQTLVEGFDSARKMDDKIVAVGGGNVPHDESDGFLKALGITLNSFWGSHGSAQGMLFEDVTQVDHIPTLNILYDKKVVMEQGAFDEDFRMVCEDPELNYRLTKAGYKILFLPNATVRHKMRPDLGLWLKNVFTYGRGRTQIIRKHKDHFSIKFLVPPMIVLGFCCLPLAVLHPIFLLPLLYFLPTWLIAKRLCTKAGQPECTDEAWAILSLNPIAYGLGMIYALFKKKT